MSGGMFLIQIFTLRVMKTRRNFSKIIAALYKLDTILSGQYRGDRSWKCTSSEISIISYVLGLGLDGLGHKLTFDNYILENKKK